MRAYPGLPVRDCFRNLDPHLATVSSVLCAFPGFPARGAPDAPVVARSTLTFSRARQATCLALQRLPVQIPLPMGPMRTVRPTASALDRYTHATPCFHSIPPARRRRWHLATFLNITQPPVLTRMGSKETFVRSRSLFSPGTKARPCCPTSLSSPTNRRERNSGGSAVLPREDIIPLQHPPPSYAPPTRRSAPVLEVFVVIEDKSCSSSLSLEHRMATGIFTSPAVLHSSSSQSFGSWSSKPPRSMHA